MLLPNFKAPCAAKNPKTKLVTHATIPIIAASTRIIRTIAERVVPRARMTPYSQRRARTEFATAPTTAIAAITSVVNGVLLSPQITESARPEIDSVNDSRVDNLTYAVREPAPSSRLFPLDSRLRLDNAI